MHSPNFNSKQKFKIYDHRLNSGGFLLYDSMKATHTMIFHNLLLTVMELAEDRKRARQESGKVYEKPELDALDVTYEDVLEYYRYTNDYEQENN